MITSKWLRRLMALLPVAFMAIALSAATPAVAQESAAPAPVHEGGEANLQLPDLSTVSFFGGIRIRVVDRGFKILCSLREGLVLPGSDDAEGRVYRCAVKISCSVLLHVGWGATSQ